MPQILQKSYPSDALEVFALASSGIDAYAAYDAMHDAVSTLKAAYLRRLLYAEHAEAEKQCEMRLAQVEHMHRSVDLTNVEGLLGVARTAIDELAAIGGLGGGEIR